MALAYGALCRGLLAGRVDVNTRFGGDDLRLHDPKFLMPRREQYVAAVKALDVFARKTFGKSVLALAVRWAQVFRLLLIVPTHSVQGPSLPE